MQYRPFSRYNSCKRQANVLCIFPNQNTCKIQLNLVQKIVHSNVYLPLQSSSFPGVFNAPNSQVFQHITTVITFRKSVALPAKRMQLRIKIPLKCCFFAGIQRLNYSQELLLISYLEKLQNKAQTSAKRLNANNNLPLQYGPFCRYNSSKR